MKPLLTGLYLHCVVPTSQFIHLSLSAYVFSIYFPTITLHDSVRHMRVCSSVHISIRCGILILYIIHTYFCSSGFIFYMINHQFTRWLVPSVRRVSRPEGRHQGSNSFEVSLYVYM
jgi:hypothetical protein